MDVLAELTDGALSEIAGPVLSIVTAEDNPNAGARLPTKSMALPELIWSLRVPSPVQPEMEMLGTPVPPPEIEGDVHPETDPEVTAETWKFNKFTVV